MKIKLYDENKESVVFELGRSFDNGIQANIYRLDDDKCLKYFIRRYSDCNDQTFKTIIDMNLSGFYKVHKMLYDSNNEFKAYTMDYYAPNKSLDILSMPIDYTVDNFRILYNSLNRLSEEGIRAVDLHSGNVILRDEGITVIDVDLYIKTLYFADDIIFEKNIATLYSLFKGLYKKALTTYHFRDEKLFDGKIIDELFSPKSSVDEVCKKLVKYKYPMDYIKSERGK